LHMESFDMNAHASRIAEAASRYLPTDAALTAPALRSFFRLAEHWDLRVAEQRKLLGDPPESTFYKWKREQDGSLGRDTLERISYLLGIWKDLQILFPDPAQAEHGAAVRRPFRAGTHAVGQRGRPVRGAPVSGCAARLRRCTPIVAAADTACDDDAGHMQQRPQPRREPRCRPICPHSSASAGTRRFASCPAASRRWAYTTASPIRPISTRYSRSKR